MKLIPLPTRCDRHDGEFLLQPSIRIAVSNGDETNRIANYLKDELARNHNRKCTVGGVYSGADVVMIISEAVSIPEGYLLSITTRQIMIEANTAVGLFYGVQTLLQLLPQEAADVLKLPCFQIDDAPRFHWRGMHLDVVRHFFTVPEIKRLLDSMARYKMNVFHWHLTDDQGWRFPSRRYSQLTSIGGWRSEPDGTYYAGSYSEANIRELIQYAAERFITVVPEIEMPGHATAAISAYPELSCEQKEIPVATEWGIFENVFCAGSDATIQFLKTVLSEVIDIFPGEYIHIGGDECPKVRWESCPRCQQRMKDNGLQSEHELQSWLVHTMASYLAERGKRAIGWDEILEGGLSPNAAVMSWQGFAGGIAAASAGHHVVMSPVDHCYFDYYQGDRTTEPKAFPRDLPLEQVYRFEPIPPELDPIFHPNILGGQGNLWTEQMPDWKQVEYMTYPRLCAMAEVLWSDPAQRNFEQFLKRMAAHESDLIARGYHVRKLDQQRSVES